MSKPSIYLSPSYGSYPKKLLRQENQGDIALRGRSVETLTVALVRLFQAVRPCEQWHSSYIPQVRGRPATSRSQRPRGVLPIRLTYSAVGAHSVPKDSCTAQVSGLPDVEAFAPRFCERGREFDSS